MAIAGVAASMRVTGLGYLSGLQRLIQERYAYNPIFQPVASPAAHQPEKDTAFDELFEPLVLMAVPKRRTTHSKKRMRMANKYLSNGTHFQRCPACGHMKLRHHACLNCLRIAKKVQKLEKKAAEKSSAV
eukprot:TRINITY_DN17822_c0_g1_i1.p1 TRINITY_DN17822_c0_g1~~TRINITY_DN17822_c0_g1_i1.p1  ORF type:complete len:138 (+),score=3.08 TRINITY_DN17822_c0_g1_i1:27-416(+)